MQLPQLTILLYAISFVVAAPQSRDINAISLRDSPLSSINSLEKRKGGGGGRSSGGASSSGGKGGSSSSGGGGRYSSSSNSGGRTVSGSGTKPAYGNRYAGGATVPYTAGSNTPTRGIAPYALPIAAVAFFPGLWLFPVFAYPYGYGYNWYANGRNHTSNVTCLCEQYSECGCDPDGDSTALAQELTNNGSSSDGAPVNSSTVRTIDYANGTTISYINGTLDNGTTAAGGTDPSSPATKVMINYGGYWVMIATVVAGVMMA